MRLYLKLVKAVFLIQYLSQTAGVVVQNRNGPTEGLLLSHDLKNANQLQPR